MKLEKIFVILIIVLVFTTIVYLIIDDVYSNPEVKFCLSEGYNSIDILTAESEDDLLSCSSYDNKVYKIEKECIKRDKFLRCLDYIVIGELI